MSAYRFGLTAAAVFLASLLEGGLVATPAARAAITGSSITTPSDPSFFTYDQDASSSTFAISGTTSGGDPSTDQVDINCYFLGGTAYDIVASNVPLNPDGSFSVPNADLSPVQFQACTLRAVPVGTTPSDLTPCSGPTIGVGERQTSIVSGGPNDGQVYDYYLYAQQLTGAFDYTSLGGLGLDDGYLFDPTFNQTTITFYGNAALFEAANTSSGIRSELQIDGADAYTPYSAAQINQNATELPAVSYSYSLDSTSGDLVIHETDPLVVCPDPTFPPTSTSCPSFVSAGVTDNRTITQDHDGHIAWITDVFTSTDGQAHSLDLVWDNGQRFWFGSGNSAQLEYEFPGESAYSMHSAGDSVSLPASAGAILIRMHGAADGDKSTGQGAIVYDRPATGAFFDGLSAGESEFNLHQTGTVPAGGSTRFRFAYVQDYLAANVASMADTASTTFADTLTNTLTVSKAGNGSGTVTSSPGGIDCGGTCSHDYPYGTPVTLTATAATNSTFTGWSGACSGTGSCTVTTNDAASVTATFSPSAITGSSITTPSDPSFFTYDQDASSSTFAISGTTSGGDPSTDQVDINCYLNGGGGMVGRREQRAAQFGRLVLGPGRRPEPRPG